MTFDDQTNPYEAENLHGRAGRRGVAGDRQTAPWIKFRHDWSTAAAIPGGNRRRSHRPANATLLIGLGVAEASS
jgi:hypothetical protein